MNRRPNDEIEARVRELAQRILAQAREIRTGTPLYLRWVDGFMRRAVEDARFRVQALRFIDVLPSLQTAGDVARHLREYFADEELPLPPVAKWGVRNADSRLGAHATAAAVRALMNGIGHRFIGGHDTKQVLRAVRGLRGEGAASTIDLLGEVTVSETEADHYAGRYLDLLNALAPQVAKWKPDALLDGGNGRPAPRLNVSIKVSALYSQMNAAASRQSIDALKGRVRPILQAARRHGAFIQFDMEHFDGKEIVLGLFRELLMEQEFRDWPDAGIALQAYLRDAEQDLAELVDWARERGTPVTVRLVRGAYWDQEVVIARQNGWPVPVWTEKWQTDACYERCLRVLLENHGHVDAAIATHNVRSLALGCVLAEKFGVAPQRFEFQMLYGMAQSVRRVMTQLGRRVRVYVPFGELIPGMAYLVRRLLENTSGQSFARMGFMDDLPPSVLLAPPTPEAAAADDEAAGAHKKLVVVSDLQPAIAEFANEPPRRFTSAAERKAFVAAIENVRGQLGRQYPLIIAGRDEDSAQRIVSINPARPAEVVGRVAAADEETAGRAVEAACAALPGWQARPAQERAELLLRAAALLRARRDEFAAWEIFEAGKPWREADGDVCEAIDFLEYYAREALRLARPRAFHVPGETNLYAYRPRGVALVIPPWNFPLAILAGMLSAAIVVGNTAILKPSSQTPVVAAQFMRLLREAGLPDGVVNLVPGPGGVIGDFLVRHPQIHLVAFTGSLAVGARINQLAAEIGPGQRHVKRVIAEMGGKNAIIVDSDADLDDAVRGVVTSAFGYQGQKCSAASRVIVVGGAYTAFVRRLTEAARSLPVGVPEDPATVVGPVIEAAAYERIRAAIEHGQQVADLALEGDVSRMQEGYFIGPTIFIGVPPESPLAQEEIFGPVLAVMHAKDFGDALTLANGTRYALTGGVYSRSPAHLERARQDFRVGNLYLNRKITGAVVGRQPFGGFNLSGVGSKAGGPDYLMQFVEPRTVTENTLRRGFAAE